MHIPSLDAATLEACVSAATAAPSMFNTQPWRIRLDPGTVTFQVRAAPERGLRHADPRGRALHLSVGACVLNLRVAVAHFGWSPVTRLLPSPGDPDRLATVRPAEPAAGQAAENYARLYEAIWRRHTSRFPFSGKPWPPHLGAGLRDAADAEGARLHFAGPAATVHLLRLTAQAEARNHRDADRAMESRRWVQADPYATADAGLPLTGLGPQDARERLPMRDFTAQQHAERLLARPFEAAPVVALLTTEHDRRADWLRAGQALEHVLLVATAHGLRASLLHQALEWPDLRGELISPPEHTGHAQMLLRLGYGPAGPAAPRRAARAVVDEGSVGHT